MKMGSVDGYRFCGETGEQGEIAKATIYYRERPLVSLTSNMRDIESFDGISAINTFKEFVQLIGIYYHGDLYPLSRKTLMDLIARVVHAVVSPARSTRKNITAMKYVPASENRPAYIREKGDNLFIMSDPIGIGISMRANTMGSDFSFLRIQALELEQALRKMPAGSIRYNTISRLVGRSNTPPLVAYC